MKTQRFSKEAKGLITHNALLTIEQYHNVGVFDRVVRFVLGSAMIASVFLVKLESAVALGGALEWWTIMPLLSIYPMATAFLGWDPLYDHFNVSTDTSVTDQLEQLREALRVEEMRYQLDDALSHA